MARRSPDELLCIDVKELGHFDKVSRRTLDRILCTPTSAETSCRRSSAAWSSCRRISKSASSAPNVLVSVCGCVTVDLLLAGTGMVSWRLSGEKASNWHHSKVHRGGVVPTAGSYASHSALCVCGPAGKLTQISIRESYEGLASAVLRHQPRVAVSRLLDDSKELVDTSLQPVQAWEWGIGSESHIASSVLSILILWDQR